MRNSLFILLAALITISAYAQRGDNYIRLSEKLTTETHNITGFDKIDVSEDFKVYITFSDEEAVSVKANENLHDLIQVEKIGETLKVSTKSYSHNNLWKGSREVLVLYVTAKQLVEIKAEEDVEIGLEEKLVSDELKIELNEDCTLWGEIEVGKLIVNLNEDSVLDVEGSAHSMKVKAVEDSVIKGYNLIVGSVNAKLIEDSEVKLTVNGDIKLFAKEDSYFHYRGEGKVKQKILIDDSEIRSF